MGNIHADPNTPEHSPSKRQQGDTPEHTKRPPWDHPHLLNTRLSHIELQTAVQSWMLNELSLAMFQLYQELQHSMPNTQPLHKYQRMQTLLESLWGTVPNVDLFEKMRERAEHVLAQTGLEEFGFDVQYPPFYDPSVLATIKPFQLLREDVQTAPEQLCSIEIHNQEHSQPIVKLPQSTCAGEEKRQPLNENGFRMDIAETPETEFQQVKGVCSDMPQELECHVDICSTQQGSVVGDVNS